MGLAAAFITKNKDENSKAMNRKGAGRRFFQYMTPGRRLRIAGGWDGYGDPNRTDVMTPSDELEAVARFFVIH